MNPIDHSKLRQFFQSAEKLLTIEQEFEKTRVALEKAPKGDDANSKHYFAEAHNAHWQNGVERDRTREQVRTLLKEIDFHALGVAAELHNALCKY